MLDRCKTEGKNQALKDKEMKLHVIQLLKGKDLIGKEEKQKTKLLAEKMLGDVDLTEVFKDPPPKTDDQQGT